MTDRTVSVKLKAEVAGFVAGMHQAAVSVKGVAVETRKAAAANQAGMADLSRAAAIGGAALLAPLALATKAAMGWETAWAGVTKTVDGSAKQMAALEGGLRNLATILPASHEEIAGVAEAAGQLGVARGSIVGFTKTMIDLGETTNLTADEAATSIAQLMNVMQTAPEDVGRLGATLVALGNDGASTEREIIQMGQGIAGAGAMVGLAEGEVLALANAVASMGIDVEAGGSSVSRVLTDMSKAAQSGGAELDVFAKTAGMSAQEFSTAFQDAPAEAFASFIDGLAGVKAEGGNVFAILDQIGLSDVRVSRAILGMASSGDLLRDSLALQSVAWRDNTALIDEANKRYETTEARIQVARNEINDAAIDIGGSLLPVVAAGAESVGNLATSFAALPGPVKAVATSVAGVGGVTLLAAGAFGMAAPKIAATRAALLGMGTAGVAASRGIGMAAAALGPLTLAFVALSVAGQHFDAGQREGFLKWMSGIESTAPTGEAAIAALTERMQELQKIADEGFGFSLLGKDIKPTDWTGNNADAADQADVLRKRIAELKLEMQESGAESEAAAGSMQILGTSVGLTEEEVDALKSAFSGLNAMLADDSAQIDYKQGIDDLRGVFKDLNAEQRSQAKSLNINTQAGRDAKASLIGLISSANDHAQAVLDETGNVDKANGVLGRHRREINDAAEALGLNRAEVKKLMEALKNFDGTHARGSVDVAGVTSAIANLATLSSLVRELDGQTFRISGVYSAGSAINQYLAGNRVGKATGGLISGPGTGTSDSIPAWLSTGEYVIQSAAVNRYGPGFFAAANAQRLAGGGQPGHGAVATAAATAAVVSRAGDSVADIEKAIKAVDRLTQAYADQAATHDMNAKQRRRYHADQAISADEEKLGRRRDRAEQRAETAAELEEKRKEDADDKAAMLASNQAEWEFSHLTVEGQIFDLDRRIAAEEAYTDTWLSLSRQREQAVESIRAAEKAAAEERARIAEAARQQSFAAITDAIRVRDEYARTVASSITGFGAIGSGSLVGAASIAGQLTGADVGGRDVASAISGGQIAATIAARVASARGFVGDLRTLRSAGLNNESLREIMAMGPDGGSAYARALAADTSVLGSINQSQSELGALAGSFGLESSNWFNQSGITNAVNNHIRVYIGDTELTEIIRVEVGGQNQALANSLVYGRG